MKNFWRIAKNSIVTDTLVAVGVRIFIVIAVLTSVSYFHIYSEIESSKLTELLSYTQERGERESQIFNLAEDNHQLLKEDFLRSYDPANASQLLVEFEQQFIRQQDGAIRNNQDLFDAQRVAGLWMAENVILSEEVKYRAALFNRLTTQYGKSWQGRFINTYALGPENFASNFWPEIPDFVYRIPADFDIRDEEYFSISTAQNNPQKKTVWTGVYRDKQADLWMVSVETPIYFEDQHIATIGNDMALDELFRRTLSEAPEGSYNLIFRSDGRLIAHSQYLEQLKASDGNFIIEKNGDLPLKSIFNLVLNHSAKNRLIENELLDAYLMFTRISGPDWFYVTVIPRSIVSDVASSTAAIVFLFGLIALALELLVLLWVMRKKIAWPLIQLNRATLAFARGKTPPKFDGFSRNDELGRLAHSFNTMSVSLVKRDNQLACTTKVLEAQLQQLKLSQKGLAQAQSVASLGSWEFDPEDQRLNVSTELLKLLEIEKDDVDSMDLRDLFDRLCDESESTFASALKEFIDDGDSFSYPHQLKSKNKSTRFLHSTGQVERNHNNQIVLYSGTVQDLTEQYKTQQAIYESEQLFSNVFHNSSFGMAIISLDGKILQANENLCKNFGYTQREILALPYLSLVHPEQRHLSEKRMSSIIQGDLSGYDTERLFIRKDGREVCCHINVFVQKNQQGEPEYTFIQCLDITLRKQAENKLNHLAFHDQLTHLANRTLFVEFLNKAIAHYQRDKMHNFALLFLDLDGFKLVNDSLGHLAGDKLLVAITERLNNEIRESDTLARFGGDEFCILLNDVSDEAQVIELAKRINLSLSEPFILGEELVNTNASIGIVLANQDLKNAEEYLRDADSAMYHAKREGRARYAIFNSEMHLCAKRQLRLRNDLSQALQNNEFTAFYQPIVSTESGLVCGFESLIRWQHPKHGLLEPNQFLPIAEEMQLIADIDYFVLDSAMAQIVNWRKAFKRDDLYISCNGSNDLISTFSVVDKLKQLLDKHGLPADRLNIEVTENILINDPDKTLSVLMALKELGVRIHLDDFGTGYSSLSYLHRFPINNIKIDRSFIEGIMAGKKDHAIVESIVLLANRLGISVTAEGVETSEQYEKLEQIGATKTQGFYHGRPVDANTIFSILKDDPLQAIINKSKID